MENYYKELPEGYKEAKVLDAKDSKFGLWMNLASFPMAAIVLIPCYFKVKGYWEQEIKYSEFMLGMFCFILIMIAYLVVHELTHGLFYKIFTRQKLKFGISLTCAYCGIPEGYVNKKTAFISTAAPFVLHSIWMILLICLLPANIWCIVICLLFAVHFGGCSGDLVVMFLLLRLPKDVLMNDTGPKQTFYTKEKA